MCERIFYLRIAHTPEIGNVRAIEYRAGTHQLVRAFKSKFNVMHHTKTITDVEQRRDGHLWRDTERQGARRMQAEMMEYAANAEPKLTLIFIQTQLCAVVVKAIRHLQSGVIHAQAVALYGGGETF